MMAGSTDPHVNSDAGFNPESTPCHTGCAHRKFGLLRVVMYTPIVLLLSGLAALATFPELAQYASPHVGDASVKYQCPIAAMMAAFGGSGTSCSSSASSCSSAPAYSGGCCGGGIMRCGITVENISTESSEVPSGDLTLNDSSASSDESPADAIAAANVGFND